MKFAYLPKITSQVPDLKLIIKKNNKSSFDIMYCFFAYNNSLYFR